MSAFENQRLMLLKDDVVLGRFDNYTAVARFIGVDVSAEGRVTVLGITDSVGYLMEQYTIEEVLKDFARTRMSTLISRKGYCLIRYVVV